jgi:hypothetical protein
MARNMTFERVSNYRGVILVRYNHTVAAFNWPLLTYTASDGTEIHYHHASAYGPYAKRGQAKTQVNRELEYKVGRSQYESIYAFTEETVIEWGEVSHLPVDHQP